MAQEQFFNFDDENPKRKRQKKQRESKYEHEIIITLFGHEIKTIGITRMKEALRNLGFRFKNDFRGVEGDIECWYITPNGRKKTTLHYFNQNYQPVNNKANQRKECEEEIQKLEREKQEKDKEYEMKRQALYNKLNQL